MIATTIITPAQMYWITRLDGIKVMLFILAIVAAVVGLALIPLATPSSWDSPKDSDIKRKYVRLCFITGAITIISLMILIFIPSTKEMCAIHAIPAIANSEKVQGLGEEFYDLAKEWMQELKPTKGEEARHE